MVRLFNSIRSPWLLHILDYLMNGFDRLAGPCHTAQNRPSPTRKRGRWRWPVRLLLVLIVAIGMLALPLACTTTIIQPTTPRDPVNVYLINHGHTSSLVLPTNDGAMIRYVYGDWNYYALGNRGLRDAIVALFWPTLGTLGRQRIERASDIEGLRRQVGIEIEQIHTLEVERSDVERLGTRLEEILEGQHEMLVVNTANGMEFGHHPQSYSYFHNSNHVAAGWLKEIGCQVRGPAFSSRWEVSSQATRR
jgi:hypothetical protein